MKMKNSEIFGHERILKIQLDFSQKNSVNELKF